MELLEYPKWTDDDKKIVKSHEEEIEYLKSKGIVIDDKENKEWVSGEVGKGEESQQTESVEEKSEEAVNGSGDVQTHGQESTPGILKRKAGRPKKV